MKKTLILVIAALALPSVALAAKPAPSAKANPKVLYILKGKLSAYTAYDAATSTNGSITILVSSANYHGKALKTQSLTFAVTAKTRVTLPKHKSTVTDNDLGTVKVQAALRIPAASLAATLQASPARALIDTGAKGH